MTKREEQTRLRRLEQMARGEQFIHERLVSMHDELGALQRSLARMVLPRPSRRRKSYTDNVGNLVTFPRGKP
jgi:hypothetical protein